MSDKTTIKKLNQEELDSVVGGMLIPSECPKCGHDYVNVGTNGRLRLRCSNPECPNSK